MPRGFEARLEGFDALELKMRRLANSVPESLQREALFAAGEIVAAEARRLVPVRTGDLRDSIVVTDRRWFGNAHKMDMTIEGDGLKVYIGPRRGGNPDGFYGHMVEFGTVHMGAQPFMRPAFDNTRGAVQTRLGDDVRAAVVRAFKG